MRRAVKQIVTMRHSLYAHTNKSLATA